MSFTPSSVCFFLFVWTFNVIVVQCQESCRTPENTSGSCITIQECSSLYNLLQKTPVPQDTINRLRKAHCGFSGNKPKVCCENASGQTTETSNLFPSRAICGSRIDDRIIGGEETSIKAFPWMTLLEYQKPNRRGFSCGGALINNRYILTAAHCLLRIPKTWTLISVRLGEHNLDTAKDCDNPTPGFEDCNDPPLDIGIEEKIPHELYDPNNASQIHDIALLRLSKRVEYTESVRPICLPLSQDFKSRSYVGQKLTVVGWGRTEDRSQSSVKLKVQVPVKSIADCDPVYKKNGVTLASTQICAGGEKAKDSCTGDSGGPLMAIDRKDLYENYIAYGVVSFGPTPCGIENFPAIYTKVSDYIDWIQKKIRV